MTHTGISLLLPDEAATLRLGAALARGLEPGAILWLEGDLGAGKTTLVRGLLRALGFEGRVKSPTFTILEPYDLSRLSLYHFDFYRFEDPREFTSSGLGEHFGGAAACVVEWPENAGPSLPEPDVRIHLDLPQDGGRRALIEALTPRGRRWLSAASP